MTLSCETGEGFTELKARVLEQLAGSADLEDAFLARARHVQALTAALDHAKLASNALEPGDGDIAAEELRLAHTELASLTGRMSADELLGEIFSSFCIGK